MSIHGDFCPLTRGADVFAHRWTPLIIRNLLMGCTSFSEIEAGLPGISRTLLTQRLRTLEHYGVVERRPREGSRGHDYVLTEAGEELSAVCRELAKWGERWLDQSPADVDSGTVLWSLCRNLEPGDLPARRTVLRFEISDDKRYWVLLDKPHPEVCYRPPGLEDDLVFSTSREWLTKWYTGRVSFGDALRARVISVEGPRELARTVGSWGGHIQFRALTPAG